MARDGWPILKGANILNFKVSRERGSKAVSMVQGHPSTMSKVMLVSLFSLASAYGSTETISAVSTVEYAASNGSANGNYKVHEGVRCGEHFDQVRLSENDPSQCLDACLREVRCAKFSVESNGTVRDCFLFEADVQCWEASGWITGNKDTRCGVTPENSVLSLKCPFGTIISEISFASFGTPTGQCNNFSTGTCHEPMTKDIVSDVCLGEASCSIAASSKVFGEPCPVISKSLRVQAKCEAGSNFNEDTYFNAWSSRHWSESELEIPSRTQEWTAFLRALPDYPENRFSGRGIIVVAGGKYLESALVMIKMLRESGCELKIQVWHLGEAEMQNSHRMLLEPYGVETRNFEDYVSSEALAPIQANVGLRLFQLKPLAILHSDLEEVLLLDSDNCPIRDPSYLFDDPNYAKVGTVFWPDFWKTSQENPIWKIIGQEPSHSWEQESGQILIRKSDAWKAINLCVHFNTEFYMRLLNGDKDTFRFSWLASGVDFLMIDSWPTPVGTLKQLSSESSGFCGHTMLQHDFDGQPLFVHHNQLKEAALAVGENFKYQKFAPSTGSFKAVPVIGLRLSNGGTLPCLDVQDTSDPNIDDDKCIVSKTGLLDFEERYFAAKNSIPQGIFNLSATALSDNSKASESSLDTSQRLASPQRAMRAVIANKLRMNKNTTCTAIEFEVEAPTFTNDRVCETTTVCEQEEAPPTATTDRICKQSRVETTKTFAVQHQDSGYLLKNDTNYVRKMSITLTRLHSYNFVMNNVPETEPFMITLNREGGAKANAFESGVSNNDASGNSTLTFVAGASTPSKLHYGSHQSTNMGSEINIVEPWFQPAFRESTNRFTTAYSKEHILFTQTDSLQVHLGHSTRVGADTMSRLRYSCERTCATNSLCRGIYIFKTNKRVECHGLSSTGDGIADSKVVSQSIVKIIA